MNICVKTILIIILQGLLLLPGNDLRAETTIDRLARRIVRQGESNDIKVYKIEKWVRKNISYHRDEKQFNMNDRWTLPMETLQRRKGDCEDGSALIIALAVASGIPKNRLRLYAPIITPGGAHASVGYQREADEKWVWVEWTTPEAKSLGPVGKRPTMEEISYFLPIGHYLELTSENPFNMIWLLDKEWEERSRKILEKKGNR